MFRRSEYPAVNSRCLPLSPTVSHCLPLSARFPSKFTFLFPTPIHRALEDHLSEWLDTALQGAGIGFGRIGFGGRGAGDGSGGSGASGTLGFGDFCRSMRKLEEWDEGVMGKAEAEVAAEVAAEVEAEVEVV